MDSWYMAWYWAQEEMEARLAERLGRGEFPGLVQDVFDIACHGGKN